MKIDPWLAAASAGLFLLYLILFIQLRRSKKHRAALRFSGIASLKSAGTTWRVRFRWLPGMLRIMAVFFLILGFLRPREGLETIRTAREGIAIQMVIDRSSSMKQPLTFQGSELNRLQVVKRVFAAFVLGDGDQLQGRGADMIGLTSFAGFVEENAPLTLDHQSLVNFARTIRPASRIEDGTMIGDAIYFATLRLIAVDELLRNAEEKDDTYRIKSKVIILLTDGQQTRGGMHPLEAARFSRDNNIKVYTIAITGGSRYQGQDTLFGRFFSLMDRELDTSLLEEVAAQTGGYFAKAASGEELLDIYRKIDELEKSVFEERFTTYREQFAVFVTIGLVLLVAEIFLSLTLFRKIP